MGLLLAGLLLVGLLVRAAPLCDRFRRVHRRLVVRRVRPYRRRLLLVTRGALERWLLGRLSLLRSAGSTGSALSSGEIGRAHV